MPGSQHRSSQAQPGSKLSQIPLVQVPIEHSKKSVHHVPSVSRLQDPDSVDDDDPHAPASQVYVVTDRDRDPVSSQVVVYPLQLDHAPYDVEPHEVPFVLREHDRDSVVVELRQVPVPQSYVVTVRVCVPVLSQVLVYPPHADQAPYVVEPQDVPSVSRLHDPVCVDVDVVHDPVVQA